LKLPNSEHKCVNIAYTDFNLSLTINNEITDNLPMPVHKTRLSLGGYSQNFRVLKNC